MNEIINQPLVLKKKSRSSRFASWSGEGNFFYDKLLRVIYIFLLFALNFVMFIYSINAKLMEDGVCNQAVLYILGGFFVLSLVLILFLSFSKDLQNLVCAIFTMIFVAMFFYQFALFDVDNFVETWLDKKASWLTFICIIPSNWLIGLLFGVAIFFLFRYTFFMLFISLVLMSASCVGVLKNEKLKNSKDEYVIVKKLSSNVGQRRETNVVYFMIPKFPSYQFLSSVRDVNFRELRNLMIGFFATNDFEIYPNAFVENKNTMDNVVDIINQVDYNSTTSGYRGYAEFINDWDFIHGGLNYRGLEDNKLYAHLRKAGFGVSTYSLPNFNICLTKGSVNTDRCVIKGYKSVSVYDKNQTLEKNIYTLLTEWLVNMKQRDFKSLAKELARNSGIKGYNVTAENRRVSIEGATKIFDTLNTHVAKDVDGQVYMVYVDLPSDIYIYDEYCNLKDRKDWVSLKDNSLVNGGIDLKRKAYVEQTKCLLGKLQNFMDELNRNGKINKTDVFVQGVSSIRELSTMTVGNYGNFVTDKLVTLGIRKYKKPKFLINANVCLASDFTKTLLRNQDYCYSVDNMKMPEGEARNLKKNLINNSVLRGGKITSIAVNYKDWYESFKQNSIDYVTKVQKEKEDERKRIDEQMKKLELEQQLKKEQEAFENAQKNNLSDENIFIPTEDLVFDVNVNGNLGKKIDGVYDSKLNADEDILLIDEIMPVVEETANDNLADKEVKQESKGEPIAEADVLVGVQENLEKVVVSEVVQSNEQNDIVEEVNENVSKEELEHATKVIEKILPKEVEEALKLLENNKKDNL